MGVQLAGYLAVLTVLVLLSWMFPGRLTAQSGARYLTVLAAGMPHRHRRRGSRFRGGASPRADRQPPACRGGSRLLRSA